SRRRTTTTGYSRGRRRAGRGRDGEPGMRRAGTDRGLTVNEMVSPGRGETSGSADAPLSGHAAGAPESLRGPAGARRHGRFRWVVPGVVAVLVVGGVLAGGRTGAFSRAAAAGGGEGGGGLGGWRPGVFPRRAASGGGQGAAAPSTQPVVRANLSEQTPVDGTLGY